MGSRTSKSLFPALGDGCSAPPESTSALSRNNLCATCAKIPQDMFHSDVPQEEKGVDLGLFDLLSANAICPLCRLVTHALSLDISKSTDVRLAFLKSKLSKNTVFLRRSRAPNLDWMVNDGTGRIGKLSHLKVYPFEYTIQNYDSRLHKPWYENTPRSIYLTFGHDKPLRGNFREPINPYHLDFDRIGGWLVACETTHDHCQYHSYNETRNHMDLTLIDVVERRTIQASSAERYVALSYVWGKSAGFKATLATAHQFQQHGFLSATNENIPRIHKDAMELVQRVGLRYLWIDSICIIQDDPQSKEQVYSMDQIYSKALFTIIALSAVDADAGLAGVQQGPDIRRPFSSRIERVHGQDFITSFPELWDVFESSLYATRGWTFQELILSKRRLYITSHQAYWECTEAVWAEDKVGHNYASTQIDPIKDLLKRGKSDLTKWFGFYEYLIRNYTLRALTWKSDILVAFAGISSRLDLWCNERICAGIPLRTLFRSLFFVPVKSTPAPTRNRFQELNIPSWSWAAWDGPISYAFTMIDKGRNMFLLKGLIKDVRLMAVDSDSFFVVKPADPVTKFHEDATTCITESWALDHISKSENPTGTDVGEAEIHLSTAQPAPWDTAAYTRLERPVCLSFVAISVSLSSFTVSEDYLEDCSGLERVELKFACLSNADGIRCGVICAAPPREYLSDLASKGHDLRLVAISFSRFGDTDGQHYPLPGTREEDKKTK